MSKLIDREDLLEAMRNCEAVTHSVGYSDMIAIIEDAPTVTRRIPCSERLPELIDRIELRKDFCNMCEAMQPEMVNCEKKGCISMQIIDEQPTIKHEQRRGRWIPTLLKGYYTCSACEYAHTSNSAQRYCSYCGADMREEGAENADQ